MDAGLSSFISLRSRGTSGRCPVRAPPPAGLWATVSRTAGVAAVVPLSKPVDVGGAEPIGECKDRLDKSACDDPAAPQLGD